MSKENKELFQSPAQIVKVETMTDGGIRLVIDTQEITDPLELTKLFSIKKNALGWVLFKPNEIASADVPEGEVPDPEDKKKSPAQRLRGILFVYWKEVKGGRGSFDQFYSSIVEQLIGMYKEKLPPKAGDIPQ